MKTAVIGSGAWGTALASLLCKNGHDTTLWCRTPEKAAQMQETHINPRLSQVTLPEKLKFSGDAALCHRLCHGGDCLSLLPHPLGVPDGGTLHPQGCRWWCPLPRALRKGRCCV